MLFLHIKALNAKVDKCGTEHADSMGFQFDAWPAVECCLLQRKFVARAA